jgi:spore coat polysaccharide biosynthesis predicted glycosyltransferase SpsG
VLLNQNLGVTTGDYEPYVLPETTLLLGPRYALLRSEFKQHAGSYRAMAKSRRVLVTLGGADAADHTARVLNELAGASDLELDVVLGALYPHSDPARRVAGIAPERVRLHRGPDSLLDLARQADLAVTAAGSTVWELACLGTPMIVLGTADNQEAVLRGLQVERAAVVLGRVESIPPGGITRAVRALLADPAVLQDLSRRASHLVDGRGAERVVDVIEASVGRLKTAASIMRVRE